MKKKGSQVKLTALQSETLESYCDVCFVYFRKLQPKKIEEGLEVLLCTACNCKMHRCCYDLELSGIFITQQLREIVCEKCKSQALRHSACFVCQGKQGAMIVSEEQQSLHVFCALYHNQIDIISYNPRIRARKSPSYVQSETLCTICNLPNAFESCAFQSCKHAAHPYCAKKAFVKEEIETGENPKTWNHHIMCANNNLLDLSEEIIPFSLFLESIEEQIKGIFESACVDLGNRQQIAEQIYQKYKSEALRKKKSSKKLRRGGYSFLCCPEHESTPYCTCMGQNSSEEMIECESCFEWYHTTCITNTQKEDEPYFCSACISFYELKKRIVDEVVNHRSESYELKFTAPTKVSFMDVMWLVRAIDNRIAGGNVSKMTKELTKYPLRSSKMDKLIKIEARYRLEVLCEEFYQELFFDEKQLDKFKPLPVLALDESGKPVTLKENQIKNHELKKFVVQLRQFCKRQGIVDEFKGIIAELDFKEKATTDSYEQILEMAKSTEKYPEVQVLKIKAQAYSFLEIVKKVDSNVLISMSELQGALQKATLIDGVPEYLIEPLKSKLSEAQKLSRELEALIRKDPFNFSMIKATVDELSTRFKIEPPAIYLQYSEEKSFIHQLNLFRAKKLGSKMNQELTLADLIQVLKRDCEGRGSEGQVPFPACTDELAAIVSNFSDFIDKSKEPFTPIFQGIYGILRELQKQVIVYELISKSNSGPRVFHENKIERIIQKVSSFKIEDEGVEQILSKFKALRQSYKEVCLGSLEGYFEMVEISDMHSQAVALLEELQNFPLRIEFSRGSKNYLWQHQARIRRDELHQLMVLCTESQLQKHPLSLKKLMGTIARENPLVKQYHLLKREQEKLSEKYVHYLSKIAEKVDFFSKGEGLKKTRKEQIAINSGKPTMEEMNRFLEALRESKVDFSDESTQIVKMINNCIEIAYRAERQYQQKGTFQKGYNSVEELVQARKEMDEVRKKILASAEFALQKELLELYHCEIYNRMKANVLNSNYDLEKNSKLLKFAEEEKLTEVSTYKKLKEKFDSKSQKSKEINHIRNIETKLKNEATRDADILFKNLRELRKSLSIPEISQEAPKTSYIEDLKQKNRDLRKKIAELLTAKSPKQKGIFEEAKDTFLEALKSPYNIPDLAVLSVELERCQHFLNHWRTHFQVTRSNLMSEEKFKDYLKLRFKISEVEKTRSKLSELRSFFSDILNRCETTEWTESSFVSMEQSMSRLQEEKLLSAQNQIIFEAKRAYLRFWVNYLRSTDHQNPSTVVTFKKVRNILSDYYRLLQKDLKASVSNPISEQFQRTKADIEWLESLILKIRKTYEERSLEETGAMILQKWIEVDDIHTALKFGATLFEETHVMRPFDDLSKFKYKNLSRTMELNRTAHGNQGSSAKRQRPESFLYDEKPLEKFHNLQRQKSGSKKVKEESENEESEQQNRSPNIVTSSSRKKIKQILSKNVLSNGELKKYGSCENEIKMIENQIFGEFHNDVVKYFETSDKFEKLFIKLKGCPHVSRKLIEKEFEFKFIELLVGNLATVADIEQMMVDKAKEERSAKRIPSLDRGAADLPKNPVGAGNVLDMLTTGQISEDFRKDLSLEIKSIKKEKHKKKRHRHRRSRSRSRSKEDEAKFSSESDNENHLPSYIQTEYSTGNKEAAESKGKSPLGAGRKSYFESGFGAGSSVQQPLMFDPEADDDQIQDIEQQFPKGSTLKIKDLTLEFYLKKRGKVSRKVSLYSNQDYRKVTSEVVDPGLSILNIRKEKSDKEIIEYLSKPSRTKYKFLVTWIEGEGEEDDMALKELSLEVNERQKILGEQSSGIRVHVMSIKQFVQIIKFTNVLNRVAKQQNKDLFNEERMVCVIQYPADKMYQLKEKLKSFSEVQRVEKTWEVQVPLPSYDAFDTPQVQPSVHGYSSLRPAQKLAGLSIKPLGNEDALSKDKSAPVSTAKKSVEYEGWGSSEREDSEQTESSKGSSKPHKSLTVPTSPFQSIRLKLNFGEFSPIMSEEEDEPVADTHTKQAPKSDDPAESLLKELGDKPIISSNLRENPMGSFAQSDSFPNRYSGPSYGSNPMTYSAQGSRPYTNPMNPSYGNQPQMGGGGRYGGSQWSGNNLSQYQAGGYQGSGSRGGFHSGYGSAVPFNNYQSRSYNPMMGHRPRTGGYGSNPSNMANLNSQGRSYEGNGHPQNKQPERSGQRDEDQDQQSYYQGPSTGRDSRQDYQ